MTNVANVARDLLREALYRRWVLGLGLAITVIVLVLAFTLEISVIDGALAGVRLFGDSLSNAMQSTQRAFKPVYTGVTWGIYICGLLFGILACSDFAPGLLAPGRIEHLLSLPLQRWELILGTYAGVMALSVLGSLYGATLITLLLGLKSGVWSAAAFGASLAASVAFTAVYGAMLACSVFVRSAPLAAALGAALWLGGTLLTQPQLAQIFDAGWHRNAFLMAVGWLPRFSLLGHLGLVFGGYERLDMTLVRAALATSVFGLACVALAVWQFERQDH